MTEKTKVSVVVPTYNESGNVLPLISRIKKALEGSDFEIIIVDDDSPDKTAEAALKAAQELNIQDRVKVIVRKGERGLSTAVVRGLESSSGDVLVVMDADLQHPPEAIGRLIHPIIEGRADVSIGVRRGEGYKGLSPFRKVVSKTASLISKMLLPQTRKISDPMSGFFALKRSVFLQARERLNPRGFKILLELIVKGRVPPERIAEVSYIFEKRQWGKSKLSGREVLNFIWHILTLNEFRVLKFMAVGVTGIFVNEGVLWLLYYRTGISLEASAALGIESSILSNFFLNSIFTFKDRKGESLTVRILKYHLSTAVGVLVNYATLIFLTKVFGIEALLSNLIGIILGFIFNYTLSEHFVWKEFSGDEDLGREGT